MRGQWPRPVRYLRGAEKAISVSFRQSIAQWTIDNTHSPPWNLQPAFPSRLVECGSLRKMAIFPALPVARSTEHGFATCSWAAVAFKGARQRCRRPFASLSAGAPEPWASPVNARRSLGCLNAMG